MVSLFSGLGYTVGDICHEVRRFGIAKCLKKVYTMPGLEKVVLVIIPILELLKQNSIGKVDIWLEVMKDEHSLYTSVHMIPATYRLLKTPSLTKTLYLLKSFCETAVLLDRYEVVDLTPYVNFSSRLGQLSIFQSDLAKRFLNAPKDFFVVLLAITNLMNLGRKHYLEVHDSKERRKDLLKAVYSLGMVALVIMKSRFYRSGVPLPAFYHCLDIATQGANLVRYIIK